MNVRHRRAVGRVQVSQDGIAEVRKIIQSFTQRRQRNLENTQPEEQVFAEAALPYGGSQIAICGGYDADINLDFLRSAQPSYPPGFQYTQQFRLQSHRHVADFIEKQRTFMREFEASGPAVQGAGERALFMAE